MPACPAGALGGPVSTIAATLAEVVRAAVIAAGHDDQPFLHEPLQATNDPRFGDYQSNAAMRLRREKGTSPRDVAAAIVANLPDHPAIGKVEVAGPGFLNLTLDDAWLGTEVARRAADPRFDGPTPGAGRTLVIDYSSPNIAKRMHVGHLRSTIIGNALHRLYAYLGYDVVADNHLGDWGTPFGKLIVAWHRWRDDEAFAADPVGELQRLYQRFGAEAAEDEALADQAREETAKLQAGDPENRALWERFCAVSMEEFQGVYDRLGVAFDVALGESYYDAMLPEVVDELLAEGIAEEDEGAVIIRFSADDGKGLKDKVLVVRKKDGAATYGTTDIATVRYRVDRWDPARVVYVTDVRQKLHFQQFFAVSRKLGFSLDLEHVTFGMLRFGDGAVAATRSGQVINLVDVLDEAHRRAKAIVDERADEIPDEAERDAIAEAVGVGAVKYADLSQNPSSDIIFEWDKILSMQGNTAPYMMYAHTRCWSILRKAGAETLEPTPIVAEAAEERALLTGLMRLPEVIELAATTARPNLLCDHLFGLAQEFSKFYLACPVLKDGVPLEVRDSRLSLVVATARALALGLDLLGLQAPRRM